MTLRRFTYCHIVACLLALASLGQGALARAADPGAGPSAVETAAVDAEAGADQQGAVGGLSVWWLLKALGILVEVLIGLLSITAVALVIEHIMTIRQPVLMPPGLADEVCELLAEGKPAPARQRCRAEPSFLGYVLEAGLAEADCGWPAVEKAMEDAAADQSARLFRKIEYLSVIGSITPMMGLLGTVIGMMLAFHEVERTPDATPTAALAAGIYTALRTTVEGLIVAIPSLAAFAVFRNRVDQLVAEAAYVADHVFTSLKRVRTARTTKGPPPPTPPPAPPPGRER